LPGSYYRLRVTDHDGKEQYSDVVSIVRKNERFGILELFPNPVGAQLVLQYNVLEEGPVETRITDVTGRLVAQQKWEAAKGVNNQSIPVDRLEAGVYFMSIFSGGMLSEPVRFVKQ
jgi:Secretion system C-terminal sorting domain